MATFYSHGLSVSLSSVNTGLFLKDSSVGIGKLRISIANPNIPSEPKNIPMATPLRSKIVKKRRISVKHARPPANPIRDRANLEFIRCSFHKNWCNKNFSQRLEFKQ